MNEYMSLCILFVFRLNATHCISSYDISRVFVCLYVCVRIYAEFVDLRKTF